MERAEGELYWVRTYKASFGRGRGKFLNRNELETTTHTTTGKYTGTGLDILGLILIYY